MNTAAGARAEAARDALQPKSPPSKRMLAKKPQGARKIERAIRASSREATISLVTKSGVIWDFVLTAKGESGWAARGRV